MTDVERYRALLADIKQRIQESSERVDALAETCLHIESDLDSTLPEFVETTGEQPHAYYSWRRRAKTALYHKQRSLAVEKKNLDSLKMSAERLEMLVKAFESGYRGEDTEQLLLALLHLVQDVISATRYKVDEEQVGLLACVSYRLKRLQAPET